MRSMDVGRLLATEVVPAIPKKALVGLIRRAPSDDTHLTVWREAGSKVWMTMQAAADGVSARMREQFLPGRGGGGGR